MAPPTSRLFPALVLILALVGFFVFSSASLGLLSRSEVSFFDVALRQLAALLLGLGLFFISSRTNHLVWRRPAFILLCLSLLATLLVFIPGLGFSAGGARRWLIFGPITFQPAEALKLFFVLFWADWLAGGKNRAATFKYGHLPFLAVMIAVGLVLVFQPDIDSFLIIFLSGLTMLFLAGAKWRHLFLMISVLAIVFVGLVVTKPYLLSRVKSFFQPQADVLTASYQINQSLITLGSGGVFGRGFGRSIQKFKYLPEPIGDSIFSVVGEEFGFAGAAAVIVLLALLILSGLKIAARARSPFGGLAAGGIVIIIAASAFLHIGSMVGLLPMVGTSLPLISHGGTALVFTLLGAGIIVNVSRYAKRN